MKFILVSPERVNVYLSKDDIIIENINIDDLYNNDALVQDKLNTILGMAKNVTGFNKEGNQYEIDVIPMLHGELLLSISKIDEEKEKIFVGGKVICYYSPEIENVISVLLSLDGFYTGETKVYHYEKDYYLIIKIYKIELEKMRALNSILTEHLTLSPLRDIVIKDRGTLTMDNCAIETAKKYFSWWIKYLFLCINVHI